jgi:preprotein translocase subunit SecE
MKRSHSVAKESPAKPKRRIVKAQTIREKTDKKAEKPAPKKGVVRLTLHYVALPFRYIGRAFKKVGRVFVPKYFRNSWAELKQVTWPTGREAWKLTLAVIIFAVIFGVLITVVDIGLDKLFRKVLTD